MRRAGVRQAGAAGAGLFGVAALDHEFRDHPLELGAFVDPFFGHVLEGVGGDRRPGGVEGDGEVAGRRAVAEQRGHGVEQRDVRAFERQDTGVGRGARIKEDVGSGAQRGCAGNGDSPLVGDRSGSLHGQVARDGSRGQDDRVGGVE